MAKLFEEVLHGCAVEHPCADILIKFCLPHGDMCMPGLPASAASVSSCNLPGGRCANVGACPTSPRVTSSNLRPGSTVGSPARCPTSELTPAPGEERRSLRCHSLVLRTQPTLMQTLLNIGASVRSSSDRGGMCSAVSSADSDAAVNTDEGPEASVEASGTGDCAQDSTACGGCGTTESVCASSTGEGSAGRVSPRAPAGRFSPPDRLTEITIDDEPEIFLEMIRFVYLGNCVTDHSNVKALIQVADKYGIEDIVKLCLQWMQEHFSSQIFYQFLSIKLVSGRFRQLLRLSLLHALRSRRYFASVTSLAGQVEEVDAAWEQLPVSFVESLLSSDELPVASEAEVLRLISRWAVGALSRREQCRQSTPGSPKNGLSRNERSASEDDSSLQQQSIIRLHSLAGSSDGDLPEVGASGRQRIGSAATDGETNGVVRSASCAKTASSTCSVPTPRKRLAQSVSPGGATSSGAAVSVGGASSGGAPEGTESEAQVREDMLRLLKTFRKSDMVVKMSDLEPILQILQFDQYFSTKPPREISALEPGFMVYRGVGGVNGPGELNQPNVVQEPWRGYSVSLGSRDFLQQQDGFHPRRVPVGGIMTFPRLWVRIKCSSWAHREKRASKSATSHPRHSMSGPIGGDVLSPTCESVSSFSLSMPSHEAQPVQSRLSTFSQDDWEIGRKLSSRPNISDDWEIGRKLSSRPNSAVPIVTDSERIDHKVVCAVISGHMRHGIRILQRERCSIYDIEELYGGYDSVCLGGTPTEVDFELQLTVQAPNHCGICSCAFAVLPAGAAQPRGGGLPDPLMNIVFEASAEENLHFHVSSSHFDSNSTYSVALNWVLRPGFGRDWHNQEQTQ